MLGQLIDNKAVGIYGEAARFSNLWYFLPSAIVASVYPALVRVHDSKSPEKYRKRIQQFLDVLVLFALIFAIPVAIIAPFVVTKLYGPAYAVSGNVLSVLAWTFIFVSLRQGMDRWLMIDNLTRISMWSIILGLIVNVLLNLLIVPKYGEVGAAWATVIAIAVSIYLPCLLIPKLRPLFRQLVLALFAPFRIHRLISGR
jgi:O-antigen/teichoic acid export membrane protein